MNLQEEVYTRQQMVQQKLSLVQKYEETVVAVNYFFAWADGLKDSTTTHLKAMDEKMAAIITENCMLTNKVTGLMELESATLNCRALNGVLVLEDRVNELKRGVHKFFATLWKEASSVFQDHLAKPIQKFKTWFEMAGELQKVTENQALRVELQDALAADHSREPAHSLIEGGDQLKLEDRPEFIFVQTSTNKSPPCQIIIEVMDDLKQEEVMMQQPAVQNEDVLEVANLLIADGDEGADQGIVNVGLAPIAHAIGLCQVFGVEPDAS